MCQFKFLMIVCKKKQKVVKGEEVVDLKCFFTISVKNRMFSLEEEWITFNANVQMSKKIMKIKK